MRKSYRVHVGLNGVYNGDDEFMAGESIMFSGPANKVPAGYLIEDGSAVGRVAYATLFAAIGTTYGAGDGATTFNLPDSRGEFWRGLDMGRGVDVGRVMGGAQGDAIRNITGEISGAAAFGITTKSTGVASGALKKGTTYQGTLGGVAGTEGSAIALDASAVVPTASENRPRNVPKIPLIKY